MPLMTKRCWFCGYAAVVDPDNPEPQNGLVKDTDRSWICSGQCVYLRPAHSAYSPHAFKSSPYDGLCQCRAPENYRMHQSFWWRRLHPNKPYRT